MPLFPAPLRVPRTLQGWRVGTTPTSISFALNCRNFRINKLPTYPHLGLARRSTYHMWDPRGLQGGQGQCGQFLRRFHVRFNPNLIYLRTFTRVQAPFPPPLLGTVRTRRTSPTSKPPPPSPQLGTNFCQLSAAVIQFSVGAAWVAGGGGVVCSKC